ncbi:hypothetical protein [Cellulomonas gilvus]|uniref:Uncharacterized protein n=1 Tax=Cellulomonas gilvus (strain ATCC 13127 / NRRL B-14078) TaxID=593907 RepID=F8A2E5_CELGA|nr:hypothetical protein [Cellulomonas gilvus]AEI11802.1 hypothetical protein Celgi_1283 [Cellulomonas gilvus ATCC 13127]
MGTRRDAYKAAAIKAERAVEDAEQYSEAVKELGNAAHDYIPRQDDDEPGDGSPRPRA